MVGSSSADEDAVSHTFSNKLGLFVNDVFTHYFLNFLNSEFKKNKTISFN